MAEKPSTTKRAHRATYAADKKKGGYLVRVIGPNAASFVGRTVPVETREGKEHGEKLTRLIWSGIDTGNEDKGGNLKGTGQPAALYAFEAQPKDKTEELPF